MPRMPRPQCSRAAQLIGMAPAKAARKKGPDLAPTCDVRTFFTGIKIRSLRSVG
jgi:hypothetical protein